MFGNKKKKEQAAQLFQTGSRAVGTITDVQDTGTTINDNPRVVLRFRVDPLDGSPSFDAEKKATVSRVQIPPIGGRYPIFYDASDPTTFAYVTVDDDQGRATVVQMFGDAFGADASGVGLPAAPQAAAPAATADPLDQIKKLGELRDAGVLTDAEFEAKKAELLGSV
jgi:Short C-terminal domain